MFLTTCTLLPPTFIQPHTRNHSLTRLGLYILTDTQHQIILLFTSPTRLRTNTRTQAEQGAEPSSSAPTHKGQASESSEEQREQRRAARALSQGLLQGLGSRPIRARVTREGQGLLGLGLLGLGLLGLGLLGLGLSLINI